MGRLDGIAHVLAITFGDLAERTAIGSDDFAAVTLVGARLLAADEKLVGTVNRR